MYSKEVSLIHCPKCDQQIASGQTYCTKCGWSFKPEAHLKLDLPPQPKPKKSPVSKPQPPVVAPSPKVPVNPQPKGGHNKTKINKKFIALGIVLIILGPVIIFLPNMLYRSTSQYNDWIENGVNQGDSITVYGKVKTVRHDEDNSPYIKYDMKTYAFYDGPKMADTDLVFLFGNKDKSLGNDGDYAILEIQIDSYGHAIIKKYYNPLFFEIPGVICIIVGIIAIVIGMKQKKK